MESMCVNTLYSGIDMVLHILLYPDRRIYCDTGCIYSCFLDMDFEAEEGQCDVLYGVVCSMCIVNPNVLEVGTGIL